MRQQSGSDAAWRAAAWSALEAKKSSLTALAAEASAAAGQPYCHLNAYQTLNGDLLPGAWIEVISSILGIPMPANPETREAATARREHEIAIARAKAERLRPLAGGALRDDLAVSLYCAETVGPIWVSPTWEQTLRYLAPDVIGRSWPNPFWVPNDFPWLWDVHRSDVVRGTYVGAKSHYLLGNGTLVLADTDSGAIHEDGAVVAIVCRWYNLRTPQVPIDA